MEPTSRVASTAAGLGMVGVVASALGPGGAMLGALSPMAGFGVLAAGLLCGLLSILTGLWGLWKTRAASGRDGRMRALTGLGLGLLIVITIFSSRGDSDSRADFNDISTDLSNPPVFSKATIEANPDRDLGYPQQYADKQRALYPDLASIAMPAPPAEAYRKAKAAAISLGWELGYEDVPDHIEATQTSKIFRFVDDVVIRIAPGPKGSIIDVRSKSRDGQGDMGVNATRIRAFKQALASG